MGAKLHEYIIVARRKDKDWYIGVISNHVERSIEIPLSFLERGMYVANIMRDADDVRYNLIISLYPIKLCH